MTPVPRSLWNPLCHLPYQRWFPLQHARILNFVYCPTSDLLVLCLEPSLLLWEPLSLVLEVWMESPGLPQHYLSQPLFLRTLLYGPLRYTMPSLARSSHTSVTAISSGKRTHPPVYPWVWLPTGIKTNAPCLAFLCFLFISISSSFFWHLS